MDIAIEKKKGFKKKHIPYVLGALLLAFVVWLIASDHSSTLKVDSRSITIGKAEKGPFKDYIRINAQVQPMTTIHLSTTEGGVVEMRNVEEGTVVRKGDVIVTLSNLSLRVSILRSEAELAEKENILRDTKLKLEQDKLDLQQQRLDAEVKFRQDKRKFEQYEKLFEERLISKEEYLQAKEAYSLAELRLEVHINRQRQDSLQREVQIEQLENSLDNMRENMVLVRQQLENLSVKSPIDGQVGRLDAELGQWISAGTKIAQINDLTDFKLQAQVDEHYIDKVQTGLSASYEETGGTKYSLLVKKVYPEVQNGQFKTDLHFVGDRPENIRTGKSYYINIELGEPTEAVMIPRGTFYQKTGGNWIYVLSPEGDRAFKRPIRIGRQNPQSYEVIEGLDPGEKVIVSSYETYGDNDILVLK